MLLTAFQMTYGISISKYKFNMSILIRYLIFLNQYALKSNQKNNTKAHSHIRHNRIIRLVHMKHKWTEERKLIEEIV